MDDLRFTRRLDFVYHASQKKAFERGELAPVWRGRYRDLFDDEDLRRTRTQPTRHFYEWLTAVLLFESTGWLSLVENYDCKKHSRKQAILREAVGVELFEWVCENGDGMPDLFVYSPNDRKWFFCEVKGTGDRLRPHQDERHRELYERTRVPVAIAHFSKLQV